ncbi:MAG TPA: PilZ domain-containing protein [Thermodesulfovibrionales bacterium]|nr:PilZ domain-containing protein [Thermodesulfovibrionales bacterium]
MFGEETDKSLLNLCNSFMFRKCFFDFFQKMQLEGIEAARKYWDSYPCKNVFPPNTSDIFERMVDFYTDLSLMPQKQYDKLVKEHEKLLFVNTFLRETFSQLMLRVYVESGERLRQAWNNTIDRQIEMNKEIAKNFFELFGESDGSNEKEVEKPLNITGQRQEMRHKCDIPVEFVLDNGADKTVKGIVLNYSESGLCINSSIPLNKGEKIIIKGSSIPTRHETFTVRWSNAPMAGLAA